MNEVAYAPDHVPRVLIVDDDPGNRDLLQAMLASEGYDLTKASGGEEALAMIASAPPDIVLLDIMMPGMNDLDAGSRVRFSLLQKPFTADELKRRVRTLLDN